MVLTAMNWTMNGSHWWTRSAQSSTHYVNAALNNKTAYIGILHTNGDDGYISATQNGNNGDDWLLDKIFHNKFKIAKYRI